MIALESVESTLPQSANYVEHTADRSTWDCRTCGEPWPCAPAKVALVEKHQAFPSLLIMFLVSTFYEARDTYSSCAEPDDLFGRFVVWAVRWANR